MVATFLTIVIRLGILRVMNPVVQPDPETAKPEPLTREEVLKWPSLGPMSLDPRRVLALIAERDLLLEKDPKVRLDGYRELGAKCAQLEGMRDDLLAALNVARESYEALQKERDDVLNELVAARKAMSPIGVAAGELPPLIESLKGQRDEAREQRNQAQMTWDDEHDARLKAEKARDEARNELILAKAGAEGAGSMLLDVQQDSIKATKRVAELTDALKDALWVADHLGDSLNDMDVAGEDEAFDEVNRRMDRARGVLGHEADGPPPPLSDRKALLEEFLAELCEHVGTVVEPEFVTKIRNLLTPRAWDPDYDQDQRCVCGHSYYRHFDSHEQMAPVGCKYCGSDCEMFRPATSPCPRCDDDARGVLLSPEVWTACPACKRGGSSS